MQYLVGNPHGVGRAVVFITLASVLISVPMLGWTQNNHGPDGENRAHGHERNQHYDHHRGHRHEDRPGYYPYMYAQPVYVPPPVYYPPMPSPGISLFFPIEMR